MYDAHGANCGDRSTDISVAFHECSGVPSPRSRSARSTLSPAGERGRGGAVSRMSTASDVHRQQELNVPIVFFSFSIRNSIDSPTSQAATIRNSVTGTGTKQKGTRLSDN